MKSYEIDAQLKNCAEKIRDGVDPGRYIALAYAVLSSVGDRGYCRLVVETYRRNMMILGGMMRGMSLQTLLVQRLATGRYAKCVASLGHFEGLEISSVDAEETRKQLGTAVQRVSSLPKDAQGRVTATAAITAILE